MITLRAVGLDQRSRAAHEICVDVRFRHRGNPQIILLRDVLVARHIALRINHDGLARALTTDQIRVLRQVRIKNLA